MATKLEAVRPVFSGGVHYLTSPFGYRTYKNGNKTVTDHHNGIDLVGKYIAADYVCAFADGTVVDCLDGVSGKTPSQGNFVRLDHKNGVNTVYYHLKKGSVTVKKGDTVKAGRILGYMGSSGNSTGAHLHFGISINGTWQDPEPYLTGKKTFEVKKAFVAGALSGVNIPRGEDSMVLYLGKSSTGTNKWGAEVAVHASGVVLSCPVYGVGNMAIPKGGKVLSGHGKSAKWILENISEGDLVWFFEGRVHIAKGKYRPVLFNCPRTKDTLVIYDKGKKSSTNKYGYEVAFDKSGNALAAPVYGKGKMEIPDGGFVLSGHGSEGKWLYSNVKAKSRVTVNKSGGYIGVNSSCIIVNIAKVCYNTIMR